MSKVRILSIDGGGIRGIIPATVLQYVEEQIIKLTENPNARIGDYFDMIVGTSTGGILTCFYLTPSNNNIVTTKYSAADAIDFYSNEGVNIFDNSKKRSWLGVSKLFNAVEYKSDNLDKLLLKEFGTLKMSELIKPCAVTSYNMVNQNAVIFTSMEPPHKQREYYVRDVVRSTAAAPTYFTPAYIRNLITNEEMINVDGGVFANNPTMCAYAEARKTEFPNCKYPTAKDMLILSIGTGGGTFDMPNPQDSFKWGLISWAKTITDIMMDGAIDAVDHQMKNLFDTLGETDAKNYLRIDVPNDKRFFNPKMDDASTSNINKLKDGGKIAIEHALKKSTKQHDLTTFIDLLIQD